MLWIEQHWHRNVSWDISSLWENLPSGLGPFWMSQHCPTHLIGSPKWSLAIYDVPMGCPNISQPILWGVPNGLWPFIMSQWGVTTLPNWPCGESHMVLETFGHPNGISQHCPTSLMGCPIWYWMSLHCPNSPMGSQVVLDMAYY